MAHIIMRDANDCQAPDKILAKNSATLNNVHTMKNQNTIAEIRLANLRLLIEECEEVTIRKTTYRAGTAAALAAKCDTSRFIRARY